MNRLSSILLIQFVVTPAVAATAIQPHPQISTPLTGTVMAHDQGPPKIKIAYPLQRHQPQPQSQSLLQRQKNISTAKSIKPSTASSTASGIAAYYQRRQEALSAKHHHNRSQSQSQSQSRSSMPIQANQKQETTPLTGRIVHQEEEVLQATTLPPTVSPSRTLIIEPMLNPTRQNQTETKEITELKKPEYGFGTWLKQLTHQLTHHKPNHDTTDSELSSITKAQSAQLARSISAYVSESLPNSTYLLLAPLPKAQKHNLLTQALNDTLRQAGFQLVESKSKATNTQVLQYQVCQLNDGVWLKVLLNQKEANRFYALNADESLAEDAPFSVREDN